MILVGLLFVGWNLTTVHADHKRFSDLLDNLREEFDEPEVNPPAAEDAA